MTLAHALPQATSSGPRTLLKRALTTVATSTIAAAALLGGAHPAAAADSTAELRTAVVKLTNVARANKGCGPLTANAQLTTAAQRHAKDMAAKGYFSHTSADGTSWDARIRSAGFKKPGGENIAQGFKTPARVLQAWLESPGHRRNILDCAFTSIGVGFTTDGGYWVQDFGY